MKASTSIAFSSQGDWNFQNVLQKFPFSMNSYKKFPFLDFFIFFSLQKVWLTFSEAYLVNCLWKNFDMDVWQGLRDASEFFCYAYPFYLAINNKILQM